ncbi:MAG: hypothetical protein PWP24_877 [Clostridiales bacterium]|nr:hypothetical protein [Clostridiales bacterium]
MRCVRTPLEANVYPYEPEKNLEDGFELFVDIVTKGWITTNSLIRMNRKNGDVVCPYIQTRRGRTFIGEGDYIIIDDDGTKHVCSAEKIFQRYQKI